MSQTPLPHWFGPFAGRPRLLFASVGGLLVALASRFLAGLEPSTSAIIGWDVLCLSFILMMMASMAERSSDEIRARAAQDDQGRATILTLEIVAAVAAIAMELSAAKNAHGLVRALRITLAFGTVAVSWFMVHLIFALHYAHGYYDRD